MFRVILGEVFYNGCHIYLGILPPTPVLNMIKPKLKAPSSQAMPFAIRMKLGLHITMIKPLLIGFVLVQIVAWLFAYIQCETRFNAFLNQWFSLALGTGQCDLKQFYLNFAKMECMALLLLCLGMWVWMVKIAKNTVREWLYWLKHNADFKRDVQAGFDMAVYGSKTFGLMLGLFCWGVFTAMFWGFRLSFMASIASGAQGVALNRANFAILLDLHYQRGLLVLLPIGFVGFFAANMVYLYLTYLRMKRKGCLEEPVASGL